MVLTINNLKNYQLRELFLKISNVIYNPQKNKNKFLKINYLILGRSCLGTTSRKCLGRSRCNRKL